MKKFGLLITILGLFFSFSSCEDLLDKKPLDKISSADLWNSEGLIDGYMVDLYARVTPMYSWVQFTEDDWSDDIHSDNNNAVAQEAITNSYDAGWNKYDIIRLCNQAIEQVAVSEVLSDDMIVQYTAEARTLRAMVYFWMVRYFGGVMLVDKVLDPTSDMKLPRASESDMYDFIVEDLKYGRDNLPETTYLGRLNRASAHAFLIRVLLQAHRYEDAVTEGKSFIVVHANYGYSIDTNFHGIFNDFETGKESTETIFLRYGTSDGMNMQWTPMQFRLPLSTGEGDKLGVINDYDRNLYGWAMCYPTQELVDDFLMIDEDGVAKKWSDTKIWKDSYASGEKLSTQAMYKNRDKRFYSSIIYDGCIYLNDTINIRPPYWNHRTSMDRNLHRGMTGYNIRKGMYDDVCDWAWPPPEQDYHWPLLRLSEVYLNYAEALIRTNKADLALPYINETRTIHGGLPKITSTDNIWEDYKRERRCELAFENLRYWDLIRWAEYDKKETVDELNRDPSYIDFNSEGTKYVIMTVNGKYVSGDKAMYDALPNKVYNNGNTFPERIFTKKRFRFPVPKSEILENENLKQNPGWE